MELQMFSLKLCKFPYRIIGLISSILFTHCGHKQKSYLYKDKTNCIIQILSFYTIPGHGAQIGVDLGTVETSVNLRNWTNTLPSPKNIK